MTAKHSVRMLPQNVDAERGVIGSIILMPSAIDDISGMIAADDFYHAKHAILYQTIVEMWRGGMQAIDPVTLAEHLEQSGKLSDVGGVSSLWEALESVPHPAHCRYYAKIVREKSQLREVISLCAETMDKAYSITEGAEAELLLADLDARAVRLRESGSCDDIQTIDKALDDLEQFEARPEATGKTGLAELDRMLSGGLREAQSVIVAGRPGHGKSVLVCQIAKAYAMRNEPALIMSLEMMNREIAGRLARTEDRGKLRRLPLLLEDAVLNASKICSRVRFAKRKHGIKLAVLDYLQLVEPDDKKSNRERQVAEISRSMKLLAKELRIPILVACQLNRQSQNEKRKPRLSDLRESGSIEQDADVVLMLHENEEGDAEISIAKQRGGQCGTIGVEFDKPRFVFRDRPVGDLENIF